MMVSGGGPDRVFWIDFDSAQTFPEGSSLSTRQKMWIEDEVELVDYFVDALVGTSVPGSGGMLLLTEC